jgi:homogentisate 1,2-dioxygenase
MLRSKPKYQLGFLNEFATEAEPGALPKGQNAPQMNALGLYTEQFSGTPFTSPRALNRRTWTYRIRPTVVHRLYKELGGEGLLRSGPFDEVLATTWQAPDVRIGIVQANYDDQVESPRVGIERIGNQNSF